MSSSQSEVLERRVKRARTSVQNTVGKVNWDDIELGSSDDETPASKRGRAQGRDARLALPGRIDKVNDAPRSLSTSPVDAFSRNLHCPIARMLEDSAAGVLTGMQAHSMQADFSTAGAPGCAHA